MILVENGTRIACLAWRLWSGRSPPCCDNVSMYFHITLWYTVPCTYRKTEGRAVRYDQLQARVGRPMLPAPSLCNSGRIWSRSVAAGACRTAGVATNKHIPTRAEPGPGRTDPLPSCLHAIAVHVFSSASGYALLNDCVPGRAYTRYCRRRTEGKQGRRDVRRSYDSFDHLLPSVEFI
jgi:hypothetical protein